MMASGGPGLSGNNRTWQAVSQVQRRHDRLQQSAPYQRPQFDPFQRPQLDPYQRPQLDPYQRPQLDSYFHPELRRQGTVSARTGTATHDESQPAARQQNSDHAALCSFNPLTSPTLNASVDILATPELIGIAMAGERGQMAGLSLWQRTPQLNAVDTEVAEGILSQEDEMPPATVDSHRVPDVSPTLTTAEHFHDDLLGKEKPSASTPEGCKVLRDESASIASIAPSSFHNLKRTGSMLQMSQALLSMSGSKKSIEGPPTGLPRRPSLTCLDVLSGR